MGQRLTQVAHAARTAAYIILKSGGETYRAEESVLYIGKAFGYKTDVIAFPTGMTITMSDAEGNAETLISRVTARSVDMTRIERVNGVVRALSDKQISLEEAQSQLRAILESPALSTLQGALRSGGSAFFFAIMFGGVPYDSVMALVCGVTAYLLANGLPFSGRLALVSDLVAGFVVALVALIMNLAPLPGSAQMATISAMMPFLPGLMLTNAIRDSMRGDLVSGSSRLSEAILRAILLTTGVGIAMAAWRMGGIA